jgi:putative oxygen-independent coproporphyrinogen III oxidase
MLLPPLALYVHIPWCVRKCPYCDFNSHQPDAGTASIPEVQYTQALIDDLTQEAGAVQGRTISSIFFGGGTPSLFKPSSFDRLLTHIDNQIGIDSNAEITLEANPGTAEQDKFSGFRQSGINRLSIGIQSFNDQQLSRLGRIHKATESLSAITMARQAGFDNINLDLMHGLPQQTSDDAKQDLITAINCQPEHISWYQLTIETNTEFYNNPPTLPIEDELADIQFAGEQLLTDNGFQQYEVSAYAQPDRRSQHNLNYWRFGDYLGIGAGAHSKITQANSSQILRRQKTRLPQHYLDSTKDFCSQSSAIKAEDLSLEFMMNALRLNDGINTELFTNRTGLPISVIADILSKLQQQQLLTTNTGLIRTTTRGRRYLNDVLAAFT